ncbi:MAG TPA: exosome complex exonuclease Rrp41 [Candidatus Nanoarchaeia archaeon]|nr:exosome complex exonuclease Rrp41 [Candidatus Nanoarchaeia archaeon]
MIKRESGRKVDELRPIEAKTGVIPRADGSAMFKIGNTTAYAAVYGPRELHPKFLQNPETGILRCSYNMIAFSGSGERVRPGGNRRSKEISLVTEKALLPVLDLSQYPNAVIDVFIELIETDAGTRCAGICAAALALADAGIPMKDLPAAISVGIIEDQIIVDIDANEDCDIGAVDVPVCVLPRTGEITLLQMDGITTLDLLKKVIDKAIVATKEVNKIQQEALKKRYQA